MTGKRIDVAENDLIIHKEAKHASWIIVNKCTRLSGT